MNAALAERGQEGRNELQLQLLEADLRDVMAGLAFLRARPEVDAQRVAIAGHSSGGQLALLLIEREAAPRAAVVFAPAAASWESSPKLRTRLSAAVSHANVPIFLIYAANDFSVEPGRALAAEMRRLGKPHVLNIYPSVGQTAGEWHDFVHLAVSTWEPDVFAFLDKSMR